MQKLNINKLLKSAEEFYIKKDYQAAIDLILKNKDSIDKGLFHYNLGSLYLKKNELGVGRYHLEKAYKSGFINDLSSKNLSFAKSSSNIIDMTHSDSFGDHFYDLSLNVPSYAYLSLSIVIAIISINLVKKKIIKSWFSVISSLILVTIPGVFLYHLEENITEAIVLKKVEVYEGPSKIYEKNIELPPGSKIILGMKNGQWYFIERPKNVKGWVNSKNLGLL